MSRRSARNFDAVLREKILDAVKELREETGDSQQVFADRLYVSFGSVQKYEQRTRVPSDPRTLETLRRVALDKGRRDLSDIFKSAHATVVGPEYKESLDQRTMGVIREVRRELGMTQEQFAKKLKTSQEEVDRYENVHAPETAPALHHLVGLARRAGRLDLQDLLTEWILTVDPRVEDIRWEGELDLELLLPSLTASERGFLQRTLAFIRECDDEFRKEIARRAIDGWHRDYSSVRRAPRLDGGQPRSDR